MAYLPFSGDRSAFAGAMKPMGMAAATVAATNVAASAPVIVGFISAPPCLMQQISSLFGLS
jgi:hypothetical protein